MSNTKRSGAWGKAPPKSKPWKGDTWIKRLHLPQHIHATIVPPTTGLWSCMVKMDLQSFGVIKNHPDYQMDCESERLTMLVDDSA